MAVVEWNFATLWESVATALKDEAAVVQDDEVLSWRDFDETANGLAARLVDAGLTRQSKVAIY